MSLSEKKLLEEENNKAIARFKLSKNEQDLLIYPLSPWTNRLFSHQAIHYRKKVFPINEHSELAFIKKNKTPDGFIWRTNAAGARLAVLYGLVKPQALTASVIATLGQYQGSVLRRAYQRHTCSDLTKNKLLLLSFSQRLIEKLEELERTINNYQLNKSPEENKEHLLKLLANYHSALLEVSENPRLSKTITSQLKEELLQKQQTVLAYQKSVQASKDDEKNIARRFRSDGRDSLGLFIKLEILSSVRLTQSLNQSLSFNPKRDAFYRGDFHTFCVDALKLVNDFVPDVHNPVLKEHQGYFNDDKPLVFDFSGEEHQKKLMAHRLMSISHIEKRDRLVINDKQKASIRESESKDEFSLKMTPFIKWSHNFGLSFSFLRSLQFFWNTLVSVIFGLTLDLVVGLAAGLVGYRLPSISQSLRVTLPIAMEKTSFYSTLSLELPDEQYSLGTIVGFKIGNFFKNVFVDLFYGVHASVGQYKIELWDNLNADFRLGHSTPANIEKSAALYFQEIRALQKKKKKMITEALDKKYPNTSRCDLKKEVNPDAVFAKAPYQLNEGEWLDLLNALSRGTKLVADTFSHALFSQNPLTGLVFSHVYALGALAVFAPDKVRFLPKAYIELSQKIAQAMSRGHLTSSLASASFQGQIVASLTEALKNGQDSWLANASLLFEKEPADILVYATLAVGLGAILAYEVEVPILSQEIRNNMGTFPLPSLGVAGGKIGILVFDFLEAKKSPVDENDLKALKTLLKEELKNNTLAAESLLQTTLMFSFSEHKELLEALPFNTRRWLLASFRKVGNLSEPELETVKSLLFTGKDHSIFYVTITTFLNYIPLLLRSSLMPITNTLEPWYDLKNKISKDLTRIIHALSGLGHTVFSNLKAVGGALFDLIGNETLAKADHKLLNSKSLTKAMYSLNYKLDEQFEHSQLPIKEYTHPLYQQVTPPTPFKLLNTLLTKKTPPPPSPYNCSSKSINSPIGH